MKKLVLGIGFALAANAALAGSLADPIVEPTVVVEQAESSSVNHGILVPVMFLLFVGSSVLLG